MDESASIATHAANPTEAAHANLMHDSTAAASANRSRERWWIEFELQGDLRFISHHDTLRLFRRAFARARLPVRFSEGFSPHPRMTMPLPRSVGISSEAEVLIIEMNEPLCESDITGGLSAQMPDGLKLHRARRLDPGEKPQPDAVTYRFRFEQPPPADITERIDRLCQSSELTVERSDPKTKSLRSLDIRPYLLDLQLVDRDVVFTLRVTGTGTARPGEIIALLLPGSGPWNHRIHRQAVRWR